METLLYPLSPHSQFDAPSQLYSFLLCPTDCIARLLHDVSGIIRTPPASPPERHSISIVIISDTHDNIIPSIPDGDLLIHCGDMTNRGTVTDIQKQIDWLDSLPHKHKIAIAGNHDTYLDAQSRATLDAKQASGRLHWKTVKYLQHESTALKFSYPDGAIRSLLVYGAPQIPACGGDDFAFQHPRGQDTWSGSVPADVDVLVTHSPPKWHLDLPGGLGCEWLAKEDWRVQPKVHCFGHVHAGSGRAVVWWDAGQRAFERICHRHNGFVTGFANPLNTLDLTIMIFTLVLDIVWLAVWGGKPLANYTTFVNAACMNQATGKPDHPPKVVVI